MEVNAEVFAPVVAWPTVRLFLVLSLNLKWTTVSVDWNNAFCQTPLERPMYMATPQGYLNKFGANGCLRLNKSLYGSLFAPREWYQHLRKALLSLGMQESDYDPCFLYKKDMIMVLYVDDAGLAAPRREIITNFVGELRELGFDLDIENDFSSYLGIKITPMPDGRLNMTQKGLINKVLKASNMLDCKPTRTPTTQVALGSDPDGESYDQSKWAYPSIVGMLLYLANNTRPDITFAVSQVARFTHSPKKSHMVAVEMILRYLKGTSDKGLIVRPDGSYNMNTWVDADFAGLYGREPGDNPNSARSRYGYITTVGSVPVFWKSQLISEICLSTLQAEYVGLVQALRALIPVRGLIVDVLKFLEITADSRPTIICKVFEDNQGAYLLATNQRITTRTKYFSVKYHFFWSYVYHPERNPNGFIHMVECDSEKMNADYLTKGLVVVLFENNRYRLHGW